MSKRIDLLINELPFNSYLKLNEKIPLILRRFIPTNAIICDAQLNKYNKLSWAIIYQDGTDTFIHILPDNQVHLEGEHETEIADAIQTFINQMHNYAVQQAWFKQLSFNLFDE